MSSCRFGYLNQVFVFYIYLFSFYFLSESKLTAVFVMPEDASDLKTLHQSSVLKDALNRVLSGQYDGQVATSTCIVQIPKFNINTVINNFDQVMSKLGIANNASTKPWASVKSFPPVSISEYLVHHASISVNDYGVGSSSGPRSQGPHNSKMLKSVIFNKPFLFIIRHEESGVPLFYGRIVDPRS